MIWRMIWVLIASQFAPYADPFAITEVSFTVLPTDVDILMHLNNGRYFTFMDGARLNAITRTKLLSTLNKNKLYGVVASEMIRFKQSIKLFERFTVSNQLVAWDDKYVYAVHKFKVKGKLCAFALVKIRFIHKQKGVVSPAYVFSLLGINLPMQPLPDYLQNWVASEHSFYETVNK